MADGSRSFNFPLPQRSRLRPGEIVVDLFAGGGGASEALKQALGQDPALAYNHDPMAIGMHAANHPLTNHHQEDIWHADPRVDVAGRPIGWFHASPDCTHFSQAKGGQPRSRKTRALSWVVLKWIGMLLRADLVNGTNTAPRIFSMENVWQILTWGPLVAKRCKDTGRVFKAVFEDRTVTRKDGRVEVERVHIRTEVAEPGERVPVWNQLLVPDKRHIGRTWRQFVAALRALGYVARAGQRTGCRRCHRSGVQSFHSFEGALSAPSPSARCIWTVSSQRPCLRPRPRKMPTVWKPKRSCSLIEAVLVGSPITATICR